MKADAIKKIAGSSPEGALLQGAKGARSRDGNSIEGNAPELPKTKAPTGSSAGKVSGFGK